MRTRILVLMLVAGAVAAPATGAATKARYYVSLGDSLSVGFQQDAAGRPVLRPGYSSVVLRRARARKGNSRLKLVSLGCPGEDTTTFLAGGCPFPVKPANRMPQVQRALRFLKANRRRIGLVTISLGANNVVPCAQNASIDFDCLAKGIGRMKVDLPIVFRALRRAVGRKVRIATLAPYNPFLALYLRGGDYQQLALTSNELAKSVRRAVATAAAARDVLVADGLVAFGALNTEQMTDLGGRQVPVGVANVCRYTQQCLPEPQGNIHPTDAGYARLGRAFSRVLRL